MASPVNAEFGLRYYFEHLCWIGNNVLHCHLYINRFDLVLGKKLYGRIAIPIPARKRPLMAK
jgi:hypothetical protein